MEPDEFAIYGWINPAKDHEAVKRERRKIVALQAIRYGIQHYIEDIWQEWQIAVYQRAQTPPPIPVEQREVFSFGIARNLCRSYARKDRRTIPLLDTSSAREEGVAGIQEPELADRRADRPRDPINKPIEPGLTTEAWGRTEDLNNCIERLRPRAQEVLRKTYVDGKASHEVGAELGLSPDNVRQQLRRARDELRECMNARQGRLDRKDRNHAEISG